MSSTKKYHSRNRNSTWERKRSVDQVEESPRHPESRRNSGLKRKRSFDHSEESSMQPARRRHKTADESSAWDSQIIPSIESSDESHLKPRYRIDDRPLENSYGNERTSTEVLSSTRNKITDKPLIRVRTPKEINLNLMSNELEKPNSFSMGECKASAENTRPKSEEADSKNSSCRTTDARSAMFNPLSMIKKILKENSKDFSDPTQCIIKTKEEKSTDVNTESVSRRILFPSKSEKGSRTTIEENQEPTSYQKSLSSNQEAVSVCANEESYDTPPIISRTSSLKVHSPAKKPESSSGLRRLRVRSEVESPAKKCESSSRLQRYRKISLMKSSEEKSPEQISKSNTKRGSISSVDSPLESCRSTELSTSSNSIESLSNREETNREEKVTPVFSAESSSFWDSENQRECRESSPNLSSPCTKKKYSDKLCRKIVTYKNRYFSPLNSKGSYSTPRRERYSPRKCKQPRSTPRKDGKDPDSYSSATPWVGDFLNIKEDDSDTPRARPRISASITAKFSRGPILDSYQLLGDSLLVRFADQILNSRAIIGENGKYCNGLCVSGQTIDGLTEKVLHSEALEKKVIVLIGTNDFLKGSSYGEIKRCMLRLLEILEKRVSKILLLTVPPIPRLNGATFWDDWEKYNGWLKDLDNGKTIKVVDTSIIYLRRPRVPDLSSYERSMGYGHRRRPDLIHLNRIGLKLMYHEILDFLSKLRSSRKREFK